jgi:endonuclease/exonuclease/phosphatase family metal-dependent hydrolase
MLLAGDLNSGTQWRAGMRQERWGPMHDATMARIAALGFRDCLADNLPEGRGPLPGCPCGPRLDCRHVRTLRQNNDPLGDPVQVDYIFATAPLAEHVVECRPFDRDDAWALSDHCPVVADLDFP